MNLIYSHEVRIQNNELEPLEEPYIFIIERINDGLNSTDFLHVLAIEIDDLCNRKDKRKLSEWHGIENKMFATALQGKGIVKKI